MLKVFIACHSNIKDHKKKSRQIYKVNLFLSIFKFCTKGQNMVPKSKDEVEAE